MIFNKDAKFDLNFIFLSLGLMPVGDGQSAINPQAIASINCATGHYVITVQGDDHKYLLDDAQMIEFEKMIRRRSEEAKTIQREMIRQQIINQTEVMQELNSGISRGAIIAAGNIKKCCEVR